MIGWAWYCWKSSLIDSRTSLCTIAARISSISCREKCNSKSIEAAPNCFSSTIGRGSRSTIGCDVAACSNSCLACVTVNFNGYPGNLTWWEVIGGRGPTMTTPLLMGRRYYMQAYYSVGLNDVSSLLTTTGVGVAADGSTVAPDPGGADRYFTASGRTPRTQWSIR